MPLIINFLELTSLNQLNKNCEPKIIEFKNVTTTEKDVTNGKTWPLLKSKSSVMDSIALKTVRTSPVPTTYTKNSKSYVESISSSSLKNVKSFVDFTKIDRYSSRRNSMIYAKNYKTYVNSIFVKTGKSFVNSSSSNNCTMIPLHDISSSTKTTTSVSLKTIPENNKLWITGSKKNKTKILKADDIKWLKRDENGGFREFAHSPKLDSKTRFDILAKTGTLSAAQFDVNKKLNNSNSFAQQSSKTNDKQKRNTSNSSENTTSRDNSGDSKNG